MGNEEKAGELASLSLTGKSYAGLTSLLGVLNFKLWQGSHETNGENREQ